MASPRAAKLNSFKELIIRIQLVPVRGKAIFNRFNAAGGNCENM